MILKSHGFGFGLGLETFANFWRVSVSENLVSEKKSRYSFWKFWSQKKVSVSVSENLFLEKSIRFQKFGLGKKILVSENLESENLVSEKKVLVSVSVKILVLSFSGGNPDTQENVLFVNVHCPDHVNVPYMVHDATRFNLFYYSLTSLCISAQYFNIPILKSSFRVKTSARAVSIIYRLYSVTSCQQHCRCRTAIRRKPQNKGKKLPQEISVK